MTTDQERAHDSDRGLTPADLQNVRFTRASMLRPGYVDTEVDRVLSRVAEELGRLYSREGRAARPGALAAGPGGRRRGPRGAQRAGGAHPVQRPADRGQLRRRGGGVQPAGDQRRRAPSTRRCSGRPGRPRARSSRRPRRPPRGGHRSPPVDGRSATSRTCRSRSPTSRRSARPRRTQLRAYLEALLGDVEKEWGRADPAALPSAASLPPAQRQGSAPSTAFEDNSVAGPADQSVDADVARVVSVRE